MSVYRVTESNGKSLAPYLQPSQASFVPSDASATSARITGTQVVGILIAIGCLVILFLSRNAPAVHTSQGEWHTVAQHQVRSSQ